MTPPKIKNHVILSPAVHRSLLVSAVEVFPRESDGVLVGTVDGDGNYRVDCAHPYQTSKRRYNTVSLGNLAAWERVDNILSALNGSSERPHRIGGCHSHTFAHGCPTTASPSKRDIESIRDGYLGDAPELENWLEIITRIKPHVFDRAGETGAKSYRRLNRLGVTTRHTPYEGFQFITGAFLIHRNPAQGYRELRVELGD